MLRLAGLSLSVLLAAAGAQAQSIGQPLPGRAQVQERFKPAHAERNAARPCPEYGPGFLRVEGSSFCVRAGGSVRVEFGKSSRSGYGSNVGGLVQFEGRGQSGIGEVRTVVRMRGQIDRNLESGSYQYR
ncbi:hypothetical protein ASE63_00470 [Bosea sp. Root381]|uniref:hypothetical protein n=1 Tax=Bosea sp. Root381 TaxID=1736524 RepID=UPI0006FEDEA2|nr:hypothetical protein [Bosea sp. Root381]KRE17717.1 hypothetical protein ASE63_00470 [Bosea sp. Root381]